MLMNTISSSGNFIGMAGICLDRLLKAALRAAKTGFLLRFSAATRRFKEFVGRGGLHRAEIASPFRTFILSPTNF